MRAADAPPGTEKYLCEGGQAGERDGGEGGAVGLGRAVGQARGAGEARAHPDCCADLELVSTARSSSPTHRSISSAELASMTSSRSSWQIAAQYKRSTIWMSVTRVVGRTGNEPSTSPVSSSRHSMRFGNKVNQRRFQFLSTVALTACFVSHPSMSASSRKGAERATGVARTW